MARGISTLLAEFKAGLRQVYGRRLKGVYLFGSYARGEADRESDVDVLVVLDRIQHYAAEVDRTGKLTAEISLKYNVSVSKVFISATDWVQAETPFLANVRDEVVAA